MKGLTTMLKIWPIGGALIVFVEEFVDKDVAKSVAFLYWYCPNSTYSHAVSTLTYRNRLTYCLSCASLVTSIGTLVDHWRPGTATSVGVSVLFVFLPILANLTDIRVSLYLLRRRELIHSYLTVLCLGLSQHRASGRIIEARHCSHDNHNDECH